MPYYLECNQKRFPYWYGKTDPRNKILHQSLTKFKTENNFSVKNKCPYLYNLAYVPYKDGKFATIFTCPPEEDENEK